MLKHFSRRPRVRALLGRLAAGYIRLVRRTSAWTVEGGDTLVEFWDRGEPFILAFWHGRLSLMPTIWRRGMPIRLLISHHADGELIARTVEHFGFDTVRGSSTKGGTQALRAVIGFLKQGTTVGMTPDGPRGPRMRAADGVIAMARLSGAAIVPIAASIKNGRVLNTWDRFLIACPFSRGIHLIGAPIRIARDADTAAVEAARQALEDAINALTAEADRRIGRRPIEPAAIAPAEVQP